MPNPTPMTRNLQNASFTKLCFSSITQRVMMGFLFLVLLAVGKHDLNSSSPDNVATHMSGDELAQSVRAGSLQRQLAFAAFLAGSILAIAYARPVVPTLGIVRNNAPLVCFAGLTLLSALWSGDASLTCRRTAEYCIFCVGAIAAGRVLGLRGIVWFGFLGSIGYLALGLVTEVVLGTFQPFKVDYRFCGTLYPNEQAWNCVLSLIAGSALLARSRGISRIAFIAAMALGGVCLMLSKSRTSLVCGVLALSFYWAEQLFRKHILTLLPIVAISASLLIGADLLDSTVAARVDHALLAGRDSDTYENLSGRIPLWSLCVQYVSVRPLVGYGFYGFWTPERIRTVSETEGWAVPESHNGFIELMLGLGVVGLALYLVQLYGTGQRLHMNLRHTGDRFVRCYLAMLLFYVMCMFTETIAFDVGLLTFCLLCLFWSRESWLMTLFKVPLSLTPVAPDMAARSPQLRDRHGSFVERRNSLVINLGITPRNTGDRDEDIPALQ